MHAAPQGLHRRLCFVAAAQPDAHNVSAEDLKLLIPLNDPLPEVGPQVAAGSRRRSHAGQRA